MLAIQASSSWKHIFSEFMLFLTLAVFSYWSVYMFYIFKLQAHCEMRLTSQCILALAQIKQQNGQLTESLDFESLG